ncbi:hypothetical protein AMJ48_01195 [Parcubacteria bacterium DG_74_1]|nr:MAG: hypothetical protein AMJ48_01195 [Parcubacteria bacterium DG_74_1]
MAFVISNKPISNSKKIDQLYVKSEDFYKSGNNFLFLKGSTFSPYESEGEIFDAIHRKGIEMIKEIEGEFFIIFYDSISGQIYFANDRLGRESVFYYYNKTSFIISDDFWQIVNIIEPKESDFDIEAIKEFVVFDRPLFFRTIIKFLNFFPPAIIGSFSVKEQRLDINIYFEFKLDVKSCDNIDTAVERIDRLINNTLKKIKEKHPTATFGIGLSGGLDSRLVPHYAANNKIEVKSFIIGEKRLNKLFVTKDHVSARKLAKIFNLKLYEISPECTTLERKSYLITRFSPMTKARYLDTVEEWELPGFDIFLTGMEGGELFGAYLPPNIQEMSDKELVDSILQKWGLSKGPKKLSSFILDIQASQIFPALLRKIKGRKRRKLINEVDFLKIKEKIASFVKSERRKEKNNIEIYKKFILQHSSSNHKYCTFSMYCKKINYSIFSPLYCKRENTKWKPEYFLNEKLRMYFYLKKFPELSKIVIQDNRLPPFYRYKKSIFITFLNALSYFLRGSGINYFVWESRKEFLIFARKVLLKHNKFFEEIFDVPMALSQDFIPPNLLKVKQILDLISSGEYKNFCEK